MNLFLLPGIPFVVVSMLAMMKLWRKGVFNARTVESSMSVFFKAATVLSVFVYAAIITFIVLMWATLGGWAVVVGVQAYLILALLGFIFTGKL